MNLHLLFGWVVAPGWNIALVGNSITSGAFLCEFCGFSWILYEGGCAAPNKSCLLAPIYDQMPCYPTANTFEMKLSIYFPLKVNGSNFQLMNDAQSKIYKFICWRQRADVWTILCLFSGCCWGTSHALSEIYLSSLVALVSTIYILHLYLMMVDGVSIKT